jgi:hypothetical protein
MCDLLTHSGYNNLGGRRDQGPDKKSEPGICVLLADNKASYQNERISNAPVPRQILLSRGLGNHSGRSDHPVPPLLSGLPDSVWKGQKIKTAIAQINFFHKTVRSVYNLMRS